MFNAQDNLPWLNSLDRTPTPGNIKKVRKPRAKKVNKISIDQARLNHIDSEKRRREIVRSTYDKLVEIVPDLTEEEGRSEINIYLKTMNFLRFLYERNEKLRKDVANANKADSITDELTWNLSENADLSELQ